MKTFEEFKHNPEGANYTKPNDPDHVDDPKEWLNGSLIFARALSKLLEEGTGVVTTLVGDAYNPVGTTKNVIVFNMDGMITIEEADEVEENELLEGTIVKIVKEENV